MNQMQMQFQSGRSAQRGHIAAIIKMALELKKMLSSSKKDEEGESSSEEVEESGAHTVGERDEEWERFCGKELKV